MNSLLRVLVFSLLAVSNLLGQAASSDQQVVAEIGNQKLTAADLEQKEAGRLLQARYQYYLSQRKAVDDLVDQQLLTVEATKKHLSVDELLQQEVYKGIQDPTEDQLKVYYEGIESSQPYESMRVQILEHIRELRKNKARAAYLAELRKRADITITLMPPTASVDISQAYVDGNRDSQIMVVEFADYECPYCQRVSPQLKRLKAEYGDRIAIAYKDLPLPMHQNSQKAAEAARCAGEQGQFWQYHDLLYSTRNLDVGQLKEDARLLKLDQAKFDQCLDGGLMTKVVRSDYQEGTQLGLTGTPSFFINGHFFSGAADYESLKLMVDQQIAVNRTMQSQTTLSKR